MKKSILLISCFIALTVVLTGCTHAPSSSSQKDVLFNEYQRYSELLNENHKYSPAQLNTIFSFFTDRKQKDLLNTQTKTPALLQELVSDYLSFPLWIHKPINYFEVVDAKESCLLINGYTEKEEPIAINISFKKLSKWQVDEVHVEYLAPFNQFFKKAICNRKARDVVRFKEMM